MPCGKSSRILLRQAGQLLDQVGAASRISISPTSPASSFWIFARTPAPARRRARERMLADARHWTHSRTKVLLGTDHAILGAIKIDRGATGGLHGTRAGS